MSGARSSRVIRPGEAPELDVSGVSIATLLRAESTRQTGAIERREV